jgi:adenylate cyclase
MSVATAKPALLAIRTQEILAWLAEDAWYEPDSATVVEHWMDRILALGLPIRRMTVLSSALHPEVIGHYFRWIREEQKMSVNIGNRQQVYSSGAYDKSPFKLMIEDGMAGIRRRLFLPAELDDFAILSEFREAGVTDYVALLGAYGAGGGVFGTFATDRPVGFTTEELCATSQAFYGLTHILETHMLRTTAVNLLDTYVGKRAGQRILGGQIGRGSGEGIGAVIWFSDLRNFTAMSDHLPRDVLIALLNDYFDHLARPIESHGGEILKFMGDGMLAVFPTAELGGEAEASRRAIAAAKAAREAVDGWNGERQAQGLPAVGHGIALHAGEVNFGNVGSSTRLDFTVVGPAVNLVHRLERLCGELDVPLILSEAVARHVPDEATALGARALRGLREPQGVFTLAGLGDGK